MHLVDHREAAQFVFQEVFVLTGIAQRDLQDKIVFAGKVQADLYFRVQSYGCSEVLKRPGGMGVEFDERDQSVGRPSRLRSRRAVNFLI